MAEARTLLQCQPLLQPHEAAQLYAVYDGGDYKVALSTIYSAITKAKLGLANVDNTSDIDKPVSSQVFDLLTQYVTQQEFLARTITPEQVSRIANSILRDEFESSQNEQNNRINDRATVAEVNSRLNPLESDVTDLKSQVQSLQGSGYITVEQALIDHNEIKSTLRGEFSSSINAQRTAIDQAISDAKAEVIALTDDQIRPIGVKADTATSDILLLASRLSQVETEASTSTTSIVTLTRLVTDVEALANEHENDINRIDSNISVLTVDVNELKHTSVPTLDARVTVLENSPSVPADISNRVTSLETRVTVLEAGSGSSLPQDW